MKRGNKNLGRYFASGQLLETSLAMSGLFNKDRGLHRMSFLIANENKKKPTVIDNIALYGNTILIIEAKNFTELSGALEDQFWNGKGKRDRFKLFNPISQNAYHRKMLTVFLHSRGIKQNQYKLEDYVVVPDTCKLGAEGAARKRVIYESELDRIKSMLSDSNPELNPELAAIFRER